MREPLTYHDLYAKVLAIFPNAQLGEDRDGQLLIYTDMRVGDHDAIEPMTEALTDA